MAVMPTDQMSQSSLYPPLISTAATSGAILRTGGIQQQVFLTQIQNKEGEEGGMVTVIQTDCHCVRLTLNENIYQNN